MKYTLTNACEYFRSLDEQRAAAAVPSGTFHPQVYQGSTQRQPVPGKKYEFLLASPQLRNSLHYLEYDDSEVDEFLEGAKHHEIKIMKSPVGCGTSLTTSGSGDVSAEGPAAVSSQGRMLSTCSIGEIQEQIHSIRSQESVSSVKHKSEEHEETRRQLAITLSELEKQK